MNTPKEYTAPKCGSSALLYFALNEARGKPLDCYLKALLSTTAITEKPEIKGRSAALLEEGEALKAEISKYTAEFVPMHLLGALPEGLHLIEVALSSLRDCPLHQFALVMEGIEDSLRGVSDILPPMPELTEDALSRKCQAEVFICQASARFIREFESLTTAIQHGDFDGISPHAVTEVMTARAYSKAD
ncbi:hypothetical protein DDZ13_07380 [Coraliomargarita sinensis]|uniref:Uncharacterized protein n=1 Tax=Coraliomargarita sinensis TaxID=2174842 RepID=A0A317ZFR0_9BACT|nr:hypothetical protein [Coraliomargarita sinensis]PXA04346.1 hypothetical protein DDZ13_07380 [Coraliomargarita sinensis]